MRTLSAFKRAQVFLNYPFDPEFEPMSDAMHFSVIAAGLIPLCAHDLSVPDKPRLELLVEAIVNCDYSAHDFSRCTGEGPQNFSRFNMPIEMGMALFHAIATQRQNHRCIFFVSNPHDYKIFASDLSGLDPKSHESNDIQLMSALYEWLRDIGGPLSNSVPTPRAKEKYELFKQKKKLLEGSGLNNQPSHDEKQELMYQICSDCNWWDWRENKLGLIEFPQVPLSWLDP